MDMMLTAARFLSLPCSRCPTDGPSTFPAMLLVAGVPTCVVSLETAEMLESCSAGEAEAPAFYSCPSCFHFDGTGPQQGLTMSIDITFIPNHEHVPKYPEALYEGESWDYRRVRVQE
jgi:hypothetical protein